MKRLTLFLILLSGMLCAHAQEGADTLAQPAVTAAPGPPPSHPSHCSTSLRDSIHIATTDSAVVPASQKGTVLSVKRVSSRYSPMCAAA